MVHETIKYALPILLVSLVSSALVLYGWMKRNTPMGKSYSAMMLVITLWLLLFSIGLVVNAPAYKLIVRLEYIVIVALPVAWLVFATSFAGLKKWFSPLSVLLLLILPVILIGAALFDVNSNLLFNHHTFFGMETPSGVDTVVNPWDHVPPTFWFTLHVAFSLIYFIVGTVVFIKTLQKDRELERQNLIVLILGILIPWLGNVTFIFRFIPFTNLDLAPFIFVLAGTLIAWGLFYNQVVNIITIAHKVLIDRMGDGLIVLDKQNWVLEINLSALSLFRMNKASVVGHPATKIFSAHPDIKSNLRHISGKNIEIKLVTGEKKRFYSMDILPLYAGKGLYAGKIILLKEITLLKETEQRLEVAKKQAENAEVLKSAFLANLSHEIKTPMNAIIGFSELLNDQSVSEEEKNEFIDHIRNSGSNLLHLIDDIIDISKLDAGQIKLVSREIDLSKLMAELFAMVNESLLLEDKGHIDLILDTNRLENDLTIIGDPERIRQVAINLLDNAVKFTKSGSIEFGYYLKNDLVNFFVKDTGVGIPFDKHKLIFDRFGRVYTSNKQEYGGTGLGLALCKGLVKLMGGDIGFESIYDKGSTFHFSIPYKPADTFEPKIKPLSDSTLFKHSEPIPKPQPESQPEPEPKQTAEPIKYPELSSDSEPDPKPEPEHKDQTVEESAEELVESIRDHVPDVPEDADLIFTPDQTPSGTMDQETAFSGFKLLVIDFEDMAYLFIEMVLRPTQIQIIRAKSLKQGMNLLKGGTRVSGLLVSSDLPDASLTDAIRTLRDHYPQTKSIAITPFVSSTKRKACLAAGAINVVPKPIKQKELLAAVRNLTVLDSK